MGEIITDWNHLIKWRYKCSNQLNGSHFIQQILSDNSAETLLQSERLVT